MPLVFDNLNITTKALFYNTPVNIKNIKILNKIIKTHTN